MDLQQWSQQWADSQIKEALEEGVDTTNDSEEQTEQCSHGEVAIGCGIHPFLERLLYLRIRPLLAPLLQVHCCVYYVLAGLIKKELPSPNCLNCHSVLLPLKHAEY